MSKISDFTSLTGAGVDTAADVLPIIDDSETGTARNKKITVAELLGLVAVDNEAIDDRVAALLTAGTNITLTYDDGAGTLTIDAAGGGGGASVLDDLTDVDTTGVSDGDVLTYDSGSGDWVAAAAVGGDNKRIISVQLTGTALTASEILAALTPPDGETWTFPANFTGSTGKKLSDGVNPASSYTIDVSKNGSTVGTITISTAGAVSFATAGGTSFSLTGGTDGLRIVGNATPDAAVGYAFTLVATYA